MNILFLGYWDVQDPLTTATIFPHLKILSAMPQVVQLVFANTQRLPLPDKAAEALTTTGAIYEPLYSKNLPINLLNKFWDFVHFPRKLSQLVGQYKIDLIIGRGAPAGALAYLTWKMTRTSFIVESLEPHAEYMVESGIWNRYDPRYIYQKRWEKKLLVHAVGLMPVAENFRNKLIKEGVNPVKVRTAPCAVNMADYQFDRNLRSLVRKEINIDQEVIVGIYVGKFGGIYYENEAFHIFLAAMKFFGPNFHLIILSGNRKEDVRSKLESVAFPSDRAFIDKVPPTEVNKYLCAADFAFSTIKPAISRKCCSPIKNGEYWANGLPILLTEGVGDDSNIIKNEGGGALFNLDNPNSLPKALAKIKRIISKDNYRAGIVKLAEKHRSFNAVKEAYEYFLESEG